MGISRTERPTSSTIAQADIAYSRNYMARAVVNLTLGTAELVIGPAATTTMAQLLDRATAASQGAEGAVAILAEGDSYVLRPVLQPSTTLAVQLQDPRVLVIVDDAVAYRQRPSRTI